MKLTRKLSLVLVAGILVVSVLRGGFRVQQEIEVANSAIRERQLAFGRSIRRALIRLWKTDGEAKALSMLDELEGRIALRWVSKAGAMAQGRKPRIPPETLASLPDSGTSVVVSEEKADRLVTYVPVVVDANLVGVLEISELLAAHEALLRETLVNVVLGTSLAALTSMIIATLAGVFLVGRPISLLIAKARRIGGGDLSGPLFLSQRDELGELANEMNAMCDHLARAKEGIHTEAAARIAALELLRHADRLATVGRLASGMAHELGTPLNVVAGRAEMIATGEVTGGEAQENAKIISAQTDRMIKLIRHLLDFGRRDASIRGTVDLCQIARDTMAILTPLAKKHSISFEFSSASSSLKCDVDPTQIDQVLSNLLINAIQAMPRGGVVAVNVKTRTVRRPDETEPGPARTFACLSVSDCGPGIAPDALPHVFEPFFTTKDVGEGTGLGLSVAYGIVGEHGGWIDVNSHLGQGSLFSVYLPMVSETPPSPPALAAS